LLCGVAAKQKLSLSLAFLLNPFMSAYSLFQEDNIKMAFQAGVVKPFALLT
jgi:hypothetical protein